MPPLCTHDRLLAANKTIHRIAVFRALQLGDLLVAIPAFRALRAAAPTSEITLVSLPWANAFAGRWNKYIDRFIAFPGFPGLPEQDPHAEAFPDFISQVQRCKFDLAIQLHGSGSIVNSITALFLAKHLAGFYQPNEYRPNRELFIPWPDGNEISRNLKMMQHLGCESQGLQLDFPISPYDERDLAEAIGPRARMDRLVCIHPGARLQTRRWPAERFAAVGDWIAALGYEVVITGSQDELALCGKVSAAMRSPHVCIAGKTSLGAIAALLKRACLTICNDTGVSHIAAAVGAPSVVIASGSDPQRWAPLDKALHPTIFSPIDCRPCNHAVCPIGQPCSAAVDVGQVCRAALSLLRPSALSTHSSHSASQTHPVGELDITRHDALVSLQSGSSVSN